MVEAIEKIKIEQEEDLGSEGVKEEDRFNILYELKPTQFKGNSSMETSEFSTLIHVQAWITKIEDELWSNDKD